jgi:hypothetical protein
MYSISDFIIGLSNRGERFRSEMIDMIEGEGLAERYDDVRYAYDYLLEQIEEEADSEEEFLAQRALRTDEEIEEDDAEARKQMANTYKLIATIVISSIIAMVIAMIVAEALNYLRHQQSVRLGANLEPDKP